MAAPNDGHIFALLAAIAEQSGEQVSEFRLDYLAAKVKSLGETAHICVALEKLLDSSRRFPTVADVAAAMGKADPTARDGALMLADRVISAVAKYGELQPGNVKGAKAIELALGPAAWELVMRQGGWNVVVDRAGDGATFRAQLRDVADSYLKIGAIKLDDISTEKLPSHFQALVAVEKLELPPSQPQKLIDITDKEIPF